VPRRYSSTTGRMLPEALSFFWDMAFMTRKKTRIGATPFRALTNKSPKI
jgi:hypothetical protein